MSKANDEVLGFQLLGLATEGFQLTWQPFMASLWGSRMEFRASETLGERC